MSRPPEPASRGIGSALKDARRRIGMDVKEAEERTKIRAKYLRALEAEDWEILPAPAYVRGFLRTYGNLVGLDGEMLADEFRRRHEAPLAQSSAAAEPALRERLSGNGARRAPGSRSPSRGPLIAGIAILVIVLLIVLGTLGGGDGGPAPSKDGGTPKGQAKKGGNKGKGGTKKKSKNAKDKVKNRPLVPINVTIDPRDAIRVCLVGGTAEALIDSQTLAPGAKESFGDHKNYRLDLQGAGTVKLEAGGLSQKLTSDGTASFEADSSGIREIDYAGPNCP